MKDINNTSNKENSSYTTLKYPNYENITTILEKEINSHCQSNITTLKPLLANLSSSICILSYLLKTHNSLNSNNTYFKNFIINNSNKHIHFIKIIYLDIFNEQFTCKNNYNYLEVTSSSIFKHILKQIDVIERIIYYIYDKKHEKLLYEILNDINLEFSMLLYILKGVEQ